MRTVCAKTPVVRFLGRTAILGVTRPTYPKGPSLDSSSSSQRAEKAKSTTITKVGRVAVEGEQEYRQLVAQFEDVEHIVDFTVSHGKIGGYHLAIGPVPSEVHYEEVAVDLHTGNSRVRMWIEASNGRWVTKRYHTMFNPHMTKHAVLREIVSAYLNRVCSTPAHGGSVLWQGVSESGTLIEGFELSGKITTGYPARESLPGLLG